MADAGSQRTERDSLGEITIDAEAPFGINTVRGVENFALGGASLGEQPRLVRALLQVKLAAVRANLELQQLPRDTGWAIERACTELIADADNVALGRARFPVPILEGSGGTSINMNINEVIANVALRALGEEFGRYDLIHPNDHVNLGQSTNDVVPTALALAVHSACRPAADAVRALGELCLDRAVRWADVLRTGRTCLQPAQPMTLGEAFGGYGAGLVRAADGLAARAADLLVVPLGATAIGTGLGAAPGYRAAVIAHLADITDLLVQAVDDYFDGTQNGDAAGRVSAELRTCATQMSRLAADVTLLSSDFEGRPELLVPAVQAGSSIMPGKINPVIPITVRQAAYAVFGNDAAVALATADGQLELNHFEPLIADRLLESAGLVAHSASLFAERCLADAEPDVERCMQNLMTSPALSTALVEQLGYEATSELVKAGVAEGRPFIEIAVDRGLIDPGEIEDLLRRSTQGPDAQRPPGN